MKKVVCGLFVLMLMLSASPGWAASLKLTIHDGKVSLDAQGVTIRQIMAEWARVGKTRIINLERVTSGPVTLRLENVPEQEALDIILRSVPGYLAAPRVAFAPNESVYDRILIMATTTAVAARPAAPGVQPVQAPSSNVTQLRASPLSPQLDPGLLPEPGADEDADDDSAIAAAAAAGLIPVPAMAPGTPFSPSSARQVPTDPPSQQAQPQTPSPASTATNPWNAPVGALRPGPAPPPAPAPTATQPTRVVPPRPPQTDR